MARASSKHGPAHVHRLDPADDEVDLAAETFRMLADPTRLRLALRLLQGEQSVNDLARAIGRPASGVSQHLAKLRLARLVETRREGTTIYYRFTNVHVRQLLEDAFSHTDHVSHVLPDHGPTRTPSRADPARPDS